MTGIVGATGFRKREVQAIAVLYEGLVQLSPTLGVQVARAVARSRVDGAERGLLLLEAIEPVATRNDYQRYWSARAHLLQQLNRPRDASHAYVRAIGLSEAPEVRRFLADKKRSVDSAR